MSKNDTLADFRSQLDEIDARIIELLADRFQITREIGAHKASTGKPPRDLGREAKQLDAIEKKAKALNVNPDLARLLLQTIIDEVAKEHTTLHAGRKT